MKTAKKNFKRLALALGLSIAVMPGLVNGKPTSLTAVNKDKPSIKAAVAKLIDITLKSGTESKIEGNLPAVIGLSKTMPMMKQELVVSESAGEIKKRAVYVIYENEGDTEHATPAKRALWVYIVTIKRSGLDKETRYFRMDLAGNLDKAVMSQSKFDESGKVVRGSGVKADKDINSPEVRKIFETELNFWLNDWLKKELKAPAKKAP